MNWLLWLLGRAQFKGKNVVWVYQWTGLLSTLDVLRHISSYYPVLSLPFHSPSILSSPLSPLPLLHLYSLPPHPLSLPCCSYWLWRVWWSCPYQYFRAEQTEWSLPLWDMHSWGDSENSECSSLHNSLLYPEWGLSIGLYVESKQVTYMCLSPLCKYCMCTKLRGIFLRICEYITLYGQILNWCAYTVLPN